MKYNITLRYRLHKQHMVVLVLFPYDFKLKELVKALGCRWSQSLSSWYFPYHQHTLSKFIDELCKFAIVTIKDLTEENLLLEEQGKALKLRMNSHQKKIINDFKRYLQGKRLSESTVETYSYLVTEYLLYSPDKKEVTQRTVEKFIETIYLPKKVSISTHRQFIGAINHYFTFRKFDIILDFKTFAPKKDKKLPNVLSKAEVLKLIQVTKNLKHRVCITLLYSSGLRIGELLNLKISDLDFDRNMIKVVQSKGRKDRYVPLAQSALPMLKNYLYTYDPNYLLIEGMNAKKKYTQASVRKFLFQNCQKAGIEKKVTLHALRHSYATHLLESSTVIRYVKTLLGHSKPKTTMIYTHVRSESLQRVTNPLDSIVMQLRDINKKQSYWQEENPKGIFTGLFIPKKKPFVFI